MSDRYYEIEYYYRTGRWLRERVLKSVADGDITKDEADCILGRVKADKTT